MLNRSVLKKEGPGSDKGGGEELLRQAEKLGGKRAPDAFKEK